MFTVLFAVADVATPAAAAAAAAAASDALVRLLVGLPGHLYKAE